MVVNFLLIIITTIIIANLLYFILPSLAPIPFFPTNKKDIPTIVKILLNFKGPTLKGSDPYKDGPEIIDLGAGTGTVIFALADEAYHRKINIKLLAVEIHPLLAIIMNIRRLFHPYRQHISIIRADMFRINFQKMFPTSDSGPEATYYLYIGTKYMNRLKKNLASLPLDTRIVSYMYPFKSWKNKLRHTHTGIVNNLYEYTV